MLMKGLASAPVLLKHILFYLFSPSAFMIQLLHKPQIWFSVSLPEQLREGEEEVEEGRRRRKVKVKYRQIEGRRNRENNIKE